jgi:hypothetical protein
VQVFLAVYPDPDSILWIGAFIEGVLREVVPEFVLEAASDLLDGLPHRQG